MVCDVIKNVFVYRTFLLVAQPILNEALKRAYVMIGIWYWSLVKCYRNTFWILHDVLQGSDDMSVLLICFFRLSNRQQMGKQGLEAQWEDICVFNSRWSLGECANKSLFIVIVGVQPFLCCCFGWRFCLVLNQNSNQYRPNFLRKKDWPFEYKFFSDLLPGVP